MAREVIFYRTFEGKCAVEQFLDALSDTVARKVTWTLRLLEDIEGIIPSVYFKKLTNTHEIWECRIKAGRDNYRILGFLMGNSIVLTNGFLKKTEKTPPREIEKAVKAKKDLGERGRMRL